MRLSSITLFLVLVSVTLFADSKYVIGPQKITFRTSPETSGKIISMLSVETKMEVLEELDTGWSKVKDSEGNEGYVLTRFLTTDTPYQLRFKWLESKNKKLQEKYDILKEDHSKIKNELGTVNSELNKTKTNLDQSNQSYQELKEGSSQYVQLKEKYDELNKQFIAKDTHVEKLESQLSKSYIIWFVAGAGVLLVGWLIGLTSRKKKGYGSQIIID